MSSYSKKQILQIQEITDLTPFLSLINDKIRSMTKIDTSIWNSFLNS